MGRVKGGGRSTLASEEKGKSFKLCGGREKRECINPEVREERGSTE